MNALRIFRSGLMVGAQEFRIFWNWRTWFGGWILRTFTTAATWALLGKALGSQQQLRFILIGMAVIQGTGAVGWTVAASTWDRMDGIYPLLVAAPPSLVPSLMGRTVVWMLNGLATFFVTFAILASVFRMPIPFSASLLLPVVVAIICASYYAFALFMGSLVIRAPQFRNVVHNVASTIITTICGVVVPVNFWPSEIGWAASVFARHARTDRGAPSLGPRPPRRNSTQRFR